MKKIRVKSAMRFTVNDKIGRSQVKTIEDDGIADRIDEETPFNFPDARDAVEIYTIHKAKSK
jgi:hypothetical protein